MSDLFIDTKEKNMMLLLNFLRCAAEQKIDICRYTTVHSYISVCVQIYIWR